MTRILELDSKGGLWLLDTGMFSETSTLLGVIDNPNTYLLVPVELRDRYSTLHREWMARREGTGETR